MNKREQAKKLYDHNKDYVEKHGDGMCWKELSAYCKKQDVLYKIFSSL